MLLSLRRKVPWQQVVDAALRMTIGDRCEGGLEIGEGLDAVDLTGFDQRCDAAPSDTAFVMTREERILAIKGDGADQVFDAVVVC